MTLPKFLQSSANAEQLSLTVKGVASSIIPVVLLLTSRTGLTADVLNGALNEVLNVLIVLSGLVSAVVTAVGAVRKVVNALKQKQ